MNSTKSRLLKRLYKPYYRESSYRADNKFGKALRKILQASTVSAEEAMKNWGMYVRMANVPDLSEMDFSMGQDGMRIVGIDEASGIDKTVYSQIKNGQVSNIEEAEFKEMQENAIYEELEEKRILFAYKGIESHHLILKAMIAIALTILIWWWLK